MFNLLRMDLRRLFHSRSFYIVLAVTVGFLLLMILMVAAVSDPERLETIQSSGMVVVESDDRQMAEEIRGMSQLEFIYECLGSGFLLMMTCIGMTLFVNGDFSSGYVKNICFAWPRRWEYVLSKALLAGVYSGALVVVSILVSLAAPVLFGLHLAANSPVDIFLYAFWLWLPHWAFALMGLGLVLLTRSSTLGIILAVVSGGGLVAVLLQKLYEQFGWPNLAQYMLSMVTSYQCVPMPDTEQINMILGCAAAWAGVYLAGSMITMEKRDI